MGRHTFAAITTMVCLLQGAEALQMMRGISCGQGRLRRLATPMLALDDDELRESVRRKR